MAYIAKWNKSYASREEYNTRFKRYTKIDKFIKDWNDPAKKNTHTVAHNKFSDWTQEEFDKLTGKNRPMPKTPKKPVMETNMPKTETPNGKVDWRDSGCVTAVQDMGQCAGAGPSISATEVIETKYC